MSRKLTRAEQRELHALWNELVRQPVTNADLIRVMSSPLRRRAWGKLLQQNPTADELYRALQQSPTPSNLLYVFTSTLSTALRRKIATILINHQDVTNYMIIQIVILCPSLRKLAFNVLLARNVPALSLVSIIGRNAKLARKIWAQLDQESALRPNLVYFVRDVRSLRTVAADRLLTCSDVTAEELKAIVCIMDGERRSVAWKRLKRMQPSDEMLRQIGKAVPSLKREALSLVKPRSPHLIINAIFAFVQA